MTDPYLNRIEAIGEQLRSKINSKFQTSTFLAGFALSVLGIQLSVLWQLEDKKIPVLIYLSISVMIFAIILFIGAIIKLDELTMPKRFWNESSKSSEDFPSKMAYLTDDNLWALKNRMVFYWVKLTLRATYLTAASLGLMLLPHPIYEIEPGRGKSCVRWFIFMGLVIVVLLALLYIGSKDEEANQKFPELKRPVD